MDQPTSKFNDEVVWGINRNLFEKYFINEFIKNTHKIATLKIPEHLERNINENFDKSVEQLKKIYI